MTWRRFSARTVLGGLIYEYTRRLTLENPQVTGQIVFSSGTVSLGPARTANHPWCSSTDRVRLAQRASARPNRFIVLKCGIRWRRAMAMRIAPIA